MDKIKIYGNASADLTIIRLVGEHEKEIIDSEIEALSERTSKEHCVMAVPVNDWNYEMTPWGEDSSINSGANEKLDSILEAITEYEKDNYSAIRKYILVGYSLAGLFCLWASYQTDKFDVIVAVSPSVWYPNWIEYAAKHECKASKVYLSLGKKEHKTRNILMSTVSDKIKKQYELISSQQIETCLEWNEGNHFTDVSNRILKGVLYYI